MSVIDSLLLPFQLGFMQNAFLAAMLVALPMALLSCLIVLKGWSLMGDAIAHAVLPGIVLAYLLSIPLAIGAFAAGLFCAMSTSYLKANTRLREDTVMGVVFSAMFAFGVVLYRKIDTDLHLDHLLLGDVLGIQSQQLWQGAAICLGIVLVVLLRGRDLLMLIFDPGHGQVVGLNLAFWRYALQAMLALTIVAALQSVGMILAIALLILPGAIALIVARRFRTMLITASLVAVLCAFGGVYISFYIDSAPAATIVLLMALVFCLSLTLGGIKRLKQGLGQVKLPASARARHYS